MQPGFSLGASLIQAVMLGDKDIERKLEEEEKEDEEREESSRKERDREKAKMGESSLAYYPCAAVLGSPQVAVALLHN